MAKEISNTRVIVHPDLGEVKIIKRRKCKRLSISVNHNNQVKVTIPLYISFKTGEQFLFEKEQWIKNARIKIGSTQKTPEIINELSFYQFHGRTIYITRHSSDKEILVKKFNPNQYYISVSNQVQIENNSIQLKIKKALVNCIKKEAKVYLTDRVEILAQKHSFNFKDVKVKLMKSRWGSCSYHNTINLNILLVFLPEDLSDFIILHELVHTIHKNHGVNFWNLLEKIDDNTKEKTKLLRKFKLNQWNLL